MTNSKIETALLQFYSAAERGYTIANKKYLEIVMALEEEVHHLELINSKKNKFPQLQKSALLAKQDEEIELFKKSIVVIRENIDALRKRQKNFSVVVYGREMSGKSTLMEILALGNSSSIETGGH